VLKGRTFSFRNQDRTATDVPRLFAQVDKELHEEIAILNALDRQSYLAHRSLASQLDGARGGPRDTELLTRYRFHLSAQGLLLDALRQEAQLQSILQLLSKKPQLEEQEFNSTRKALSEIRHAIETRLEEAKSIPCPALTNVPAGSTLYSLIMDRDDKYMMPMVGDRITGEWLGKLCSRVEGVLTRIKRVHFKSLGSLLACQERLTAESTAALSADRADQGRSADGARLS